MKTKDIFFALIFIAIFLPFFIFPEAFEWFKTMTNEHGVLMSILKFAILATLGECLGLRIKTGSYSHQSFGILPRAVVWGFLGMFIFFAFFIFKSGVSILLEKVFALEGAIASLQGDLSMTKFITVFCASTLLNTIFAPVMMTFHKITDIHIEQNQGKLSCLLKCIKMADNFKSINWDVQWGFVFKKTIPFFWIPAHTITFLLPNEFQVLFAALLGVVLGVILAIAGQMGKKQK